MHKKVIVFFIIATLFLSSFNPSLQTTSISTKISASTNNVSMIGLDLQLKKSGTNYFSSVNSSRDAPIVDVTNETNAIFISSFVNENPISILLSSFTVNLFNSTVQSAPAQTLIKAYNTIDPTQEVHVDPNSSYTELYSSVIPLPKLNENFQVQYQYQYALTTNLSNTFTLNSPFNFSIHAIVPPYAPPTFVIWFWWAISGLIVIQLIIGWYGNRKLKKKNSQS